MSGFLGSQQSMPTTGPATQNFYKGFLDYLGGQGFNSLNPSAGDNQKYLQPYLDLFTQQNARNFAQAKESAGNLTGSGLGQIIGSRMADSSAQQNAFLANLLEQHNQSNANRFAQLVLGGLNSNAGQVQNYYQPGMLDYIMQGATTAAKAGAFGGAGAAAGAAGAAGAPTPKGM